MKLAPRVMFLALDAASKDLAVPWAEQGILPTLAKLMETGARAATANAPGLYTGSVWPSIWTGVNPGRHGCYYFEQLVPGSYRVAEFLGRDIRIEPFWNEIGRSGRRIAVFDVPKAPLCTDINGLQIVDWGTHDADVLPCSQPPELIDEVQRRHGASAFRRCDWVMDEAEPERTLRRHLLDRIEAKTAIAEDLLAREPWDLFMLGFGDSHCVGHQCWHLHDPTHPRHDPRLAAEIGDPLRDVYVALDSALGKILEHANDATTVIVLLSHGMSAHYDATYLLDDVLRRLDQQPAPATRAALDVLRRQWKKLPIAFTERFGAIASTVDRLPDARDRSRRRAFVVPTNANCAGIRLNVIGREPNGMLAPGAETEAYAAQLVADLHDLAEAASGRPLVREVLRSTELFDGERVGELPDLLVRWNRDTPITGVASAKIGEIVREDTSTRRTGDHRPGGMCFVRGPGVAPGDLACTFRDEDFAPTIAALLGVKLGDVDGRALLDLARAA